MRFSNKVFNRIDTDKNGLIDKEEMKSFMMGMLRDLRPGEEFNKDAFEKGFALLDRNNDGFVSREELIRHMLRDY